MAKTTRPQPFFIADDRARDFLNSAAGPWGTWLEWLDDGGDLLAWLVQAGLVPPKAAKQFRDQATPQALDKIAAQARDLREWFRKFVATHAGRQLEPAALTSLDRLNRLMERDSTYRQIEPCSAERNGFVRQQSKDVGSSLLQWQMRRHWQSPEDLLLPIAEVMGDLVCQVNFERVKKCQGATCTLWFHDASKNHTRRWCTMAVCGNRAKAAAHRAKRRK